MKSDPGVEDIMSVNYFPEYGPFETRLSGGGDVRGISAPTFAEAARQIQDLSRKQEGFVVTPELITTDSSIDPAQLASRGMRRRVADADEVLRRQSSRKKRATLLAGTVTPAPPASGTRPFNTLRAWRKGREMASYNKVSLTLAEDGVFAPGDPDKRMVFGEGDRTTQAIICSDLQEVAVGAITREESAPGETHPGELLDPRASSLIISSAWATELPALASLSPEQRQTRYRTSLEQLAGAAFRGYRRLKDIVVVDGSYGEKSPQKPFNAHFRR